MSTATMSGPQYGTPSPERMWGRALSMATVHSFMTCHILVECGFFFHIPPSGNLGEEKEKTKADGVAVGLR